MKKLWIRLCAGVLAALVLTAGVSALSDRLTGGRRTDGLFYQVTGIRPDARLLSVDGRAVSAEEYLYWLAYDCEYLTANMGSIDWNAPLTEDMTYGEYAKTDALETVKLFSAVRRIAEESDVTLTEEDLTLLQKQKDDYISYYGSEEVYRQQVALMGISEEAFDRVNEGYLLLDRIGELAATEGSGLYPAMEELAAFAAEGGYVTARLLYLPAAGLDEEADASLQALMEDYSRQLQESSDAYALMGQLAEELGMDQAEEPSTFSADTAEAALVQAVTALEEGAVSDVIRTESGFYVAIRCPADSAALARAWFSQQLLQTRRDAAVTYSRRYHSIDTGAFYSGLLEQRQALAQQFTAER